MSTYVNTGLPVLADSPGQDPLRHFAAIQRDLGIQLASAANLNQALPACLEAAIRVGGMDAAEIYLLDPELGEASLIEGVGFCSTCVARRGSRAEMFARLLNAVDQPVYRELDEGCEAANGEGCGVTLRLKAIVPIRHQDSTIGWLVAKSHSLPYMPDGCPDALEAIAAQIGGAIARIQAQEALVASRRQLKAVFDSLDDFLIVIDSQCRILETNRAVLDRMGCGREQLLGKHVTEVLSASVTAGAEPAAPNLFAQDLLRVNLAAADGTPVPIEIRLGFGAWNGKPATILLGRDLTERWKVEEQTTLLREKTALLKEIHHRVKNNLQVISSLLSLQASQIDRPEDRRPLLDSQARVQAIALLHERLYRTQDLSRIDFGEYLGAVADHILRAARRPSCDIRLRVETDQIWLGQDTALPCGLIINELVANCCKYAFPESRSGEIQVAAKRANGSLMLTVADNGVGLPAGIDLRNPSTLGLQLVDDMVYQLKGTWRVESCGGARFEIVFPEEMV